jgi:D-tyrosyl-tRNA(Tyr) deacylase
MRLVIQRVTEASVEVEGKIIGQINQGYMVLVGIGENDTEKEADYLVRKLLRLRVFEDEHDRMNISIQDINGEVLLIPNFTLYGDTSHNNRPSFSKAMKPEKAEKLFDYFCNKCSEYIHVETGEFGGFMNVSLNNNGPVTIIMEKEYND